MKAAHVLLTATLFGLLVGLTGCDTLTGAYDMLTGTVTSVAPDAMQAAQKALAAGHLAHEAAADAATVAARSGVLHGQNALTVKTWIDTSENYLTAADALVALGDAAGIEAKVSGANKLISQVQAIVADPSATPSGS